MVTSLRTTQVAAATGGGNQDFTVSGFGTPDLLAILTGFGLTNGTVATHAGIGFGASISTSNRQVVFTRAEDAVSQTNVLRWGATNEATLITSASANLVDGEADFNSFITDGARITWGNNPGAAYLMNGLLLRAPNVAIGSATQSGGADIEQSFSVGFEPDVLIVYGHTTSMNDSGNGNSSFSYGVAVNDGIGGVASQWGCALASNDNVSTSSMGGGIWSDAIYLSALAGGTTYSRALECTGFTSTEFNLTKRAGTGSASHVFNYIAFTLDTGLSAHTEIIQTPTSTGNQSYTGPGFTPQFLLMAPGFWDAVSTSPDQIDATADGAGVIAMSFVDAANQYCCVYADEDNVATANSQSLTSAQVAEIHDGTGTLQFDATLVSFDATGYTLNFASTNGTARRWGVLAIEEESSGFTSATGSASGAATVSGVGISTFSVVGSSSGVAVASSIGASIASSTASSFGAGASLATGASILASDGVSAGQVTSGATGASTISSQGLSAGASTVLAVGTGTASSTASTSGLALATAVGESTFHVVATSAGQAAAAAIAAGSASVGSSSGIATAIGIGESVSVADAVSSGVAIGTGGGAGIASSVASSSGQGIASGVGAGFLGSSGSSSGVAIVTAEGSGIASATASTQGAAIAIASGARTVAVQASSAGIATGLFVSAGFQPTVATALGIAVILGVGQDAAKPGTKLRATIDAVPIVDSELSISAILSADIDA